MKVFLDTNVVISALVFRGNEFKSLRKALEKRIQMIISEHVLNEITRVIMAKFPEFLNQVEEFLKIAGIKIIPKDKYHHEINKYSDLRDKYDKHLIACAIFSKCDYLISGDKDLLEYSTKDVKIINAKNFLKLLQTYLPVE